MDSWISPVTHGPTMWRQPPISHANGMYGQWGAPPHSPYGPPPGMGPQQGGAVTYHVVHGPAPPSQFGGAPYPPHQGYPPQGYPMQHYGPPPHHHHHQVPSQGYPSMMHPPPMWPMPSYPPMQGVSPATRGPIAPPSDGSRSKSHGDKGRQAKKQGRRAPHEHAPPTISKPPVKHQTIDPSRDSPTDTSSGSGSNSGQTSNAKPASRLVLGGIANAQDLDPEVPYPFHKRLEMMGIRFVEFPRAEDLERAPTGHTNYHRCEHALFLGQLHYDCTLDLVMWIIEVLSEGKSKPVHLHRRGAGCAMAYFESAEDASALRSMNARALFDYNGMWIAKDEDEAEKVRSYVRTIRSILKVSQLPGDCIAIRL